MGRTFTSKYINNQINNHNNNYNMSNNKKNNQQKHIPTPSQINTEGNIIIRCSLNKGPKGRYFKGLINKIDMIDVLLSIQINPGEFTIKKTLVRFKGNNYQTDWKNLGSGNDINKVFDFKYSNYIEAEIKTVISVGLFKTKAKTIKIAKKLI